MWFSVHLAKVTDQVPAFTLCSTAFNSFYRGIGEKRRSFVITKGKQWWTNLILVREDDNNVNNLSWFKRSLHTHSTNPFNEPQTYHELNYKPRAGFYGSESRNKMWENFPFFTHTMQVCLKSHAIHLCRMSRSIFIVDSTEESPIHYIYLARCIRFNNLVVFTGVWKLKK